MKLRLQYLPECALWESSLLKIAYDNDFLGVDMLKRRLAELERCDDLTTNEKHLKRAIELELLELDEN